VPLSATQQHALDALDWMFDAGNGQRQTGRSLVWALALVRAAARHPGERIEISDHAETFVHQHRQSHEQCRQNVVMLVRSDPALSRNVEMDQRHFWFHLPRPIMDWMPPLDQDLPQRVQTRDFQMEVRTDPRMPPGEFRLEPSGTTDLAAMPRFLRDQLLDPTPPSVIPTPPARPRTVWERLTQDD